MQGQLNETHSNAPRPPSLFRVKGLLSVYVNTGYGKEGIKETAYEKEGIEGTVYGKEGIDGTVYWKERIEGTVYDKEGIDGTVYCKERIEGTVYGKEGIDGTVNWKEGIEGTVYGKDGRGCLWEGWKVLFMQRIYLILWEKSKILDFLKNVSGSTINSSGA